MNWSNLKENKCPNDGELLRWGREDGNLYYGCGFSISERRLIQITTSQVTEDLERKWDKEEDDL